MALVLTRQDVSSIIDMEEVIDTVRAAHAEHAAGRASQPTRVTVPLPGTPSSILPMPAAIGTTGAAGLKLLSVFPDNPGKGLPLLSATVLLVDPGSGRCDAVLEGGLLTAYRTAAASAVATGVLSRLDSTTLGLVGAGIEARTHLRAMLATRPIDRVLVWSRTRATAERFASEMQDQPVQIEVVDTPEAATRSADILCTLTPSPTPIVHGEWFAPGLHVNAVGTHWIDKRELDTEAIARSRVVVDSRDANELECGDLMIPVKEGAITTRHFDDELGELLNGEKPGRAGDTEITMYQSVGVAIQDVATARMLVSKARAEGVGSEVGL
jgi:ornithine cyclodeaminase/alanine dehydrogenase